MQTSLVPSGLRLSSSPIAPSSTYGLFQLSLHDVATTLLSRVVAEAGSAGKLNVVTTQPTMRVPRRTRTRVIRSAFRKGESRTGSQANLSSQPAATVPPEPRRLGLDRLPGPGDDPMDGEVGAAMTRVWLITGAAAGLGKPLPKRPSALGTR